jgi:hypothetical protein
MEYRHKKTGSLYVMLSQAIDCTNARDGTPVVVYAPKGDMVRVYVRDEAEFVEKFDRVMPPDTFWKEGGVADFLL